MKRIAIAKTCVSVLMLTMVNNNGKINVESVGRDYIFTMEQSELNHFKQIIFRSELNY